MKSFKGMALLAMLLLACGCAGIYGMMVEDAPTVLFYPADEGVKEQRKVATIVVPYGYGLWIDGQLVKEMRGEYNPELRVSRNMTGTTTYMVDVSPGAYTLAVTCNEQRTYNDGKQVRIETIRTINPLVVNYRFSAGMIYSLEIIAYGTTGSVRIEPVPYDIRDVMIKNRSQAVF